MITLNVKNNLLKWLLTLGFVLTFFSLSYFFYQVPGSDCTVFSGLTKYSMKTMSLDPSQPNHTYFQWPGFFIIIEIANLVSGVELIQLQFLQYTIIAFLLTTTMYVYASKIWKNNGQLAVISFSILVFYFINFQAVPFSLALGLLFVLFMLEAQRKSSVTIILMVVLFICISLIHSFVPLFFVIYLLIRSIISGRQRPLLLFLLMTTIYLLTEISLAGSFFTFYVRFMLASPSDYQSIVSGTLSSVSETPLQVISQMFSRIVVISIALICSVGFILLIVRRKLRNLDKAIFLSGAFYAGVGFVLSILGNRSFPLMLIPVSLGAVLLFKSKLGRYVKYIFLILLILSVSIPLHTALVSRPTLFQTEEELSTANFMLEHSDWSRNSTILSHSGTRWYLQPQIDVNTSALYDESSDQFSFSDLKNFDTIIYSIRLGISFAELGFIPENVSGSIIKNNNIIYDSGYSFIAEKPKD
jgi:hypothetical protein